MTNYKNTISLDEAFVQVFDNEEDIKSTWVMRLNST